MSNAKDKIKQAWNENPIGVAMVAAAVFTGVAKLCNGAANLIDGASGIVSRRAYSKQVKHRTKNKR